MLFDLNNPEFYNQLKKFPEPDYIVYLYINDHLLRIINPYMSTVTFTNNSAYYLRSFWKEENGKLTENTIAKWKLPFYSLFCVRAYYNYNVQKFCFKNSDKKMLEYFLLANKICKEKFPKAKFVVIEYKDNSNILMSDFLKKNIQANGISVYDAEDLVGHELVSDKWRAEDKEHPNGKAFTDLANAFIKKFDL